MSEVDRAQAAAIFKDDEPATFFDQIVAGDIPVTIVFQDDEALAFRDISPQVRSAIIGLNSSDHRPSTFSAVRSLRYNSGA